MTADGKNGIIIYKTFSQSHELKPYLTLDLDLHFKYVMARFRLGVSDIATHHYRYREFDDNDLLCPLCRINKEDEIHFVLCCPVLQDIRKNV